MKKLLTLLLLSIQIEAYHDFDFEQIKQDGERLEATEFKMDFNLENPKHKYFAAIHALDIASTMYAIENRNSLYEGNPLLPARPELEEIIIQKTLVLYLLSRIGIFSELPEDQWHIDASNAVMTAVVINNLYQINKYD